MQKSKLDFVALAKSEMEALRKKGDKFDGTVNLTVVTNNRVVVDIEGYVYFDQLRELTESTIMAGDDLEEVIVNINSPGGSAFAGIAIANFLRGLDAKVTTVIQSAAMSAAGIIFLSGDSRLIGDVGSIFMSHRAMGFLDILEFGNQTKLQNVDVQAIKDQTIDLLNTLDEIILDQLVSTTKLNKKQALEMIENEKQIGKAQMLKLNIATGVDKKDKTENEETEDEETEETQISESEDNKPSTEEPDNRAADIELMSSAHSLLQAVEGGC